MGPLALGSSPLPCPGCAYTGSSWVGLIFAHLSPGIEICLHLLAPVLHRYLWKLHWAQLLGIDLDKRKRQIREPIRKGLGSPPWTQGQEKIQKNSCLPQLWAYEGVWGIEFLGRSR